MELLELGQLPPETPPPAVNISVLSVVPINLPNIITYYIYRESKDTGGLS
jgi:hypothetical protein